MKTALSSLCLIAVAFSAMAQRPCRVKDRHSGEVLPGVSVLPEKSKQGYVSDASGVVTLPQAGTYTFRMVGYVPLTRSVTAGTDTLAVELTPDAESLEEVTVTSTRTQSRIEDLPLKVEVLGSEEMNEEAAMVPGNVASLLGDISIIHVQTTSPLTGNQGIRMQGLDPKYTQLLRDGLPLYEGFSGNLGVLQIPPLDLKQAEVVKGSVSTLYGGGAIGGMINLVSKTPDKPELTFLVNRSTLKESNVNGYYAHKWGVNGLTLFTGYTHQKAVDVNGDGYSDSPFLEQFSLHPRFFTAFGKQSTFNIGYSLLTEQRKAGDVIALNEPSGLHTYTETSKLFRHTVDYHYDLRAGNNQLTAKGTFSLFDRDLTSGGYFFGGKQTSAYQELSDVITAGRHTLVGGLNYSLERFRKKAGLDTPLQDYRYETLGLFAQDDWKLTQKISLQAGLRYDHHSVFGNFLLPRLSLMTKPGTAWTTRISVGTGYKTPNVFSLITPSSAQTNLSYQYFLPIAAGVKPERSTGTNLDISYHKALGEHMTIQVDQAFYYTRIGSPVIAIPRADEPNGAELVNAAYDVKSIGTDTYFRATYDELELYLGYNHTLSRRAGSGETAYLPFAPQDKFSSTFAYTIPDKWRFGIESSWVGNQYLYNNQRVPNYWFWAAMVSRQLGPVSVVVNAENLFDVRQSGFGPVVSGGPEHPQFSPLWAPQQGRIVNLAVKCTL
jgi:outer membrane receptor for ferrienterochelin and colicins